MDIDPLAGCDHHVPTDIVVHNVVIAFILFNLAAYKRNLINGNDSIKWFNRLDKAAWRPKYCGMAQCRSKDGWGDWACVCAKPKKCSKCWILLTITKTSC